MSERRSPAHWCQLLDARIMDHDGWRGDGAPAWDEPITREEFDLRFAMCTIDSRGYPDFVGHPLASRLADAEARVIERLADKLDDLYGDWDDAPITKAALTEWLRAKARDARGDL